MGAFQGGAALMWRIVHVYITLSIHFEYNSSMSIMFTPPKQSVFGIESEAYGQGQGVRRRSQTCPQCSHPCSTGACCTGACEQACSLCCASACLGAC